MRKLHYLLFAMIMGLAVSFTSCSSDDDGPVEPVVPEVVLPDANKTMQEVMALATGDVAIEITDEIVFRGVVVYNPASNNQTHTLFIQSKDAELALKLSVDEGDTFHALELGQEVAIKAKGLWIAKKFDVIIIGSAIDEKYTVASISDDRLKEVMLAGDAIEFAPKVKTIDELSKDILGTLVTIENVQFNDDAKAKAYFEGTGSYATRTLTTIDGKTIDVSTYKKAIFKDEITPEGAGSVTGILGLFKDQWQLILRSTDEVKLTESRFEIVEPVIPFVDKTVDTMDETFADAAYGEKISLDGWFSEATEGTLLWLGKEYSSNQYMQASAFDTGLDAATSWIVTPGLNLDAADSKKNFSFETKRGKSNGEVLEVYVSADFDFNTGVDAATWVKQTVTLADANADGYSAAWVNSGVIDLSSYSGTVHVAFKYVGNATTATGTYQVDNVKFNYTPEAPAVVVPSPNFETWTNGLPDGWTFVKNSGKAVTQVTDKKEGESAMKVALDAREDFNMTFATENNKTYKVSFWYKIEGTPGSNGIKLWSKIGADVAGATLYGNKLDVETEWTLYEATFDSAATDSFKFEVRGYGATGLVLFMDDVKVVAE